MEEYISREAAIKILCTVAAPTPTESWIVEKCIDRVNELPAADVRPVVHGKWVAVDGEERPCDEWDCTACGQRRTFMVEMDADDMKEFYPYCPDCGAVMDGGSNG